MAEVSRASESKPGNSIRGAGDPSEATSSLAGESLKSTSLAQPDDPCLLLEVTANPTRPNWSNSAATTQCGVVEMDFGWQRQPMGGGVTQFLEPASIRYGLTPRLDLRWGLPVHMMQSGGGEPELNGATDQWLSARYRFHEQGRVSPALALSYGIKFPTANPGKGFGSGYADHQFTLIASRDVGHGHFDFNLAGTLAGGPVSEDGATQAGLVLSLPVTKRFSAMLESNGGSQPGIADRYGAALVGGNWAWRPWMVLDVAYTRAYTAGTPRAQFTVGFTAARRSGLPVLSRQTRFARILGR
ncbi:MAG: hypothetical protein P4K83_01120 [Terracidiphilus sp.]|nr:hypothetical protein [Terracidiphilus sp.]